MLDLGLLRLLKHKDDYLRVVGRIPDSAIDKKTRALLTDFGKYFEKFPEHSRIEMETFLPLFRCWHTTLKPEEAIGFEKILHDAAEDLSSHKRSEIMRTVLELRMATKLANLTEQFNAGDLPNILMAVTAEIDAFKADVGIKDIKFIDTDIDALLLEESDDNGVRWRLTELNDSMRPLRAGDFGIIAGRPDRGKTTFLTSELTFFAPQLPADRNILWLNNEGPGKRIIPRLYSAALGATKSELLVLSAAGVLKKTYTKIMGDLHRVRVVDIHNMDNFSVEQLIESNNAGVVVYDMIDNIRGFGQEARTDRQLEEMYKWGRNMAVKYDHIGLATSQISADGEGKQFPTMDMLKDSKTGKQGACDFILMIGASNDVGYDQMRFIGVPKNKLRRDGGAADPKATVKYDPKRARYEDMPTIASEDKPDGYQ